MLKFLGLCKLGMYKDLYKNHKEIMDRNGKLNREKINDLGAMCNASLKIDVLLMQIEEIQLKNKCLMELITIDQLIKRYKEL